MNSENKDNHPWDWETCAVCGQDVAPGRGAARLNHLGNTVNVCSPACRETFAQEPDPYLSRLAKRMREQVLRESLRLEGLDGSAQQGLRVAASQPVLGAKRELVRYGAVTLLLGSLLITLAASAMGADISTNLPAGSLTNVATLFQTAQKQGFSTNASLSAVSFGPLIPVASAGKGAVEDDFLCQGASMGDRCVPGSSNLLSQAAVECCAQAKPLRDKIELGPDSLTKRRSQVELGKTFRFFDGAVLSGSRSGESYQELDRSSAFLIGSVSGGDWLEPNAPRKSQGLRLFSWSW